MNRIKNLIGLFTFVTLSTAYSQNSKLPINPETKLVSYNKVVVVEGIDKSELFKRALNWANTFYNNPADVIREKDSVAGKIVCKPRFKISNEPDKKTGFAKDAGNVQYTLNILFKDGRYKYDLTEINWKQLSYYPIERWMDTKAPGYSKDYEYYLKQIEQTSDKTLADLEKAMLVPSKKEKKDDW